MLRQPMRISTGYGVTATQQVIKHSREQAEKGKKFQYLVRMIIIPSIEMVVQTLHKAHIPTSPLYKSRDVVNHIK